jgi:hypothetical protein
VGGLAPVVAKRIERVHDVVAIGRAILGKRRGTQKRDFGPERLGSIRNLHGIGRDHDAIERIGVARREDRPTDHGHARQRPHVLAGHAL